MLRRWWICPFSSSMRGHVIHCARPRADITKNLLFLMRHSLREASRMKLKFVAEHFYISRFTGVAISKFIY